MMANRVAGPVWRLAAILLTACVAAALLGAAGSAPAGAARPGSVASPSEVIVVASGTDAAAAAVASAGGVVTEHLPIVDGVSATVPASGIDELRDAPGVRSVTPNDTVVVDDTSESTSSTDEPRSVYARAIGADRPWQSGITGSSATVALIDTGVARVPDLGDRVVPVPDPHYAPDENGIRMVGCADFSGDTAPGERPECGDGHGHGTFMAGIIAGDGSASDGTYRGVAPDARIAEIKIAGDNGASDVSKLLAAIQYVVSFRDVISPPVRVLNLSLGTTSRQHYEHDPLNYAVQRAWTAGIVVVVAAGNTGPKPSTVTKPADDPLVVSVGATDDLETVGRGDDRLPEFSARGPATFDSSDEEVPKPDVVAPGARIVSLRPVDADGDPTPTALPPPPPDAWSTDHYRRGSGTSMSAAVVSGLAALYADTAHRAEAGWSAAQPARFKRALVATAHPVAGADADEIGAGLVSAPRTITRALRDTSTPPDTRVARGDGLLGASRSAAMETFRPCTTTERVRRLQPVGPCEVAIEGEETAQGEPWHGEEYTGDEWTGSSWYGSSWYGSSWYSSQWDPTWDGSSWYGSSWYGSSWYGETDNASYGTATPNGSSWYGSWE